MGRGNRLCFFLLLPLAFGLVIDNVQGYELYVGGIDGWVTNPSESYSSWTSRLRFSVNDDLVFVYDKAVDSVLEVSSADYSSCNSTSPFTRLCTGMDTFKLSRSGPFFFISGNASHCQAGQKLSVLVLTVRSLPSSPPPPGLPPPPGVVSPPASTPPTTPAPASETPSPPPTPTSTPSGAPASSQPPTVGSTPSTGSALTPPGSSAPSPSAGRGSSPSSESAPGSTATPATGSASLSPQSSPDTSASSHSCPGSFVTLLTAALLALLGEALLQ